LTELAVHPKELDTESYNNFRFLPDSYASGAYSASAGKIFCGICKALRFFKKSNFMLASGCTLCYNTDWNWGQGKLTFLGGSIFL